MVVVCLCSASYLPVTHLLLTRPLDALAFPVAPMRAPHSGTTYLLDPLTNMVYADVAASEWPQLVGRKVGEALQPLDGSATITFFRNLDSYLKVSAGVDRNGSKHTSQGTCLRVISSPAMSGNVISKNHQLGLE